MAHHDNDKALVDLYDEMFPGDVAPEQERQQFAQEIRAVGRYPWPKPCKKPTPWDRDFSVCANCGSLISSHDVDYSVEGTMKPYHRAVIDWIVKNGALRSVYGVRPWETVVARRHFLSCGVAYGQTRTPQIETHYQFDGSDAGNTPVRRITAILFCRCGKLQGLDFSMPEDLTLGQVIFQVLQEG